MKNNFKKLIVFSFVIVLLFLNVMPVTAKETTVDNAQNIIDGIVAFNLEKTNSKNINEWINKDLAKNPANGAEWYVLALSQSADYDFSSYEVALTKYLKNNNVPSASSRLKYALTLSAIGSTDSYIYSTLNDAIGKQGIMSYVYGLHLLNNGYSSKQITKTEIINKILTLQLSDGGFAIYGAFGDVDVTSMTIQALSKYYKVNKSVKAAVDKAVEFLSKSQNDDGTFNSYGVKNPESGAQVLVALSSLNINALKDNRFIKNEATILDGLKIFMLDDKSFSHTLGGKYNTNATTQVFYSLIAFKRMEKGKSAFYILDHCNASELQIPTATSTTITSNQQTTSKIEETSKVSSDVQSNIKNSSINESNKEESTYNTTSSTANITSSTTNTTSATLPVCELIN